MPDATTFCEDAEGLVRRTGWRGVFMLTTLEMHVLDCGYRGEQ
jgi:hypothetical protein